MLSLYFKYSKVFVVIRLNYINNKCTKKFCVNINCKLLSAVLTLMYI